MTRAIVLAKLLLCNIYHTLALKQTWQDVLSIDAHCRADLKWWWQESITQWNGVPLLAGEIQIQMEMDASKYGWGAVIKEQQVEAAGIWDFEVTQQSLNYKELLAILCAVQSFKKRLECKSVQVLMDNVTVAAQINHMGSSHWMLSTLITTLFVECQEADIRLQAKYLAGKNNQDADHLSWQVSTFEWSLHKEVFRTLDMMWGLTKWTGLHQQTCHLLPKYNSYFHDQFTSGIDAFTQDWSQMKNFIKPLVFLLPRILKKVKKEKVWVTVVAPKWKSQMWYLQLLSMLRCTLIPYAVGQLILSGRVKSVFLHLTLKVGYNLRKFGMTLSGRKLHNVLTAASRE